MEPDHPAPILERAIRVFVSSTFRDLHAEREELVKRVFPQLRKLCEQRGVTWSEVDLRWGITEEQSQRGEVLPVCLAEIDRCRPFFIGILGERYGWVPGPKHIHAKVRAAYPWLDRHLEDSVTEMEIWHGVLNHPAGEADAFFYLRDPAYVGRLPEGARQAEDHGTDDATREKLAALKERIRESGHPVREGFRDATELGEQVLADLTDLIDHLFPAGSSLDPLDREAAEHEAFACGRLGVYAGRDEYFRQLDAFAREPAEGAGLVVTGESGSGKSALLANWVARYRTEHPGELVLYHAIGATPESADGPAMLRRLLGEFRRKRGLEIDIPDQPAGLQRAFADALSLASGHGKVILVLDALNQLEDREGFPDLAWLPEVLPPNVRLISSALPGRALDEAVKRQWRTLAVQPLRPDERRRIIVEALRATGKALSGPRQERILSAPQTANPLFLRALLEELRIFGVHERLDERIDYYLGAASLDELFGRILRRYEEDYERERPGLVGESMSLIWASRRGLAEAELLDLLGNSETGEPLPQAYWSPLYLAAEQGLMSRGGRITFFHDYMRQAVQSRYLLGDESWRAAHRRLAHYFADREVDERQLEELPWQLQHAGEWEQLKDYIATIPIFLALDYGGWKYELIGYWDAIGGRFDVVEAYRQSLADFEAQDILAEELVGVLNGLGGFFKDEVVRLDEAEKIYHRSLVIREETWGSESLEAAQGLNQLASVFADKDEPQGAEPLFRRSLAIRENLLEPDHPDLADGLSNLAWLTCALGNNYNEGEHLHVQALGIYEKSLGHDHEKTLLSMRNVADLYEARGEYARSEALFFTVLEAKKRTFGLNHPETVDILDRLATFAKRRGDLRAAQSYRRRVVQVLTSFLGRHHPKTALALAELTKLLIAMSEYGDAEAEALNREVMSIQDQLLGNEQPNSATAAYYASAINNLGLFLYFKGRLDEAEPLYRRALAIWERNSDQSGIAFALNNLGMLLRAKGDFEQAESLIRRASDIWHKEHGPEYPLCIRSLHNIGLVLYEKGDRRSAESYVRRALVLREKVLGSDHPDTQKSRELLGECER